MIACAAWRVRVRAQPEPARRSLYELQRQFAAALFEMQAQGPQSDLAAELGVDPLLLAIHRNTASATLTAALALNFPAVRAIVGADFFEAAAGEFLRTRAPASACLNDYGDEFPPFLAQFAPAASLNYLADVARLEWAVSRALHAADEPALELGSLAALAPERMPFVSFEVHPAMSVLHLESPADAIWRAVLSADDAAMAALETTAEVWLLVARAADGVQVQRLDASLGAFAQRLCAGDCLQAALDGSLAPGELQTALAEHLASGRLTGWHVHEPLPAGDPTA